MSSDESTPLLETSSSSPARRSWFPPLARVYFTSFLLSLTFAFTQTSLIYAFRTMTCDAYYATHSVPSLVEGDRCSIGAIEARTANEIAIMSTTTTSCTIINLFITGYWIKRFGPKAAMFQQTAWAAMRNLCQIYAQTLGGQTGIRIIQVTQLFNIMGGAGGYQLAANNYLAILVPAAERTSGFGVLTGMTMLGSATGYSAGGTVQYFFGALAPFEVTFCLLVFSTIFAAGFLPYVAPDHHDAPTEKRRGSFLDPLKLFLPKRVDAGAGRKRWDFNLTLLGAGAFFSVLATGYVPLALQLVGTNVFGFLPAESGYMLSLTLLVKSMFLSILFPRIISAGRRFISHNPSLPPAEAAEEDRPDFAEEADPPATDQVAQHDAPRAAADVPHGSKFDLYFLRWSIFLDGLLTACVALSTHGWHLYVAAAVLPFASGTGSAAKGVTLDFVPPDHRADALSGIALIEKLAAISTVGIFGAIFAALSQVGKPTLVYLCNAAVAMIGFIFLCFVHMPREGRVALA
ncbi:major facilitator superfamily domain-containing protein [Naematelia encephala]|uniref:Major facilitator superfamily domain-containing protein n=1 Tax=Naematelia encephala TaxID=71784 RepID=A0A1Y2B8A5_9TREE|nr:major facilitator superfamily domain-containing protein [Naematelia encephala]